MSVQSIASKLSQVSMALTGMQQSGNCDQLTDVLHDLGQLDAELKSAQTQVTPETSETLRQDLVNCRMALYGMLNIVSEIRSATAERYRQVLGEQKTSFEQMNEPDQQNAYPEAYQHRQVFKQMDAVSGHIHQLNGAIMDAGYQAGRGQQNGSGTEYGDMEQNDLTSGTDTTGWF